jgi:hypothetical protein
VIAGRHDVDAQIQEFVADFARDAEAGGRVFGVNDHQVDLMTANQNAEPGLDELAPGSTDDVTNEE